MQSPEGDDPAADEVPPAQASRMPTPPDPPATPAGRPDLSAIPRTPLPSTPLPPGATPLPPLPTPQVQPQTIPHVGMFHPQSTSAIAHAELTWR